MKQEKKYKLIALIGKSGSGKDSLLKRILMNNHDLHEVVAFTTRPPREGEKNGIDYNFISGEKFGEMVLEGEMLEAACFNNWFYGTAYESLRSDCVNIGIFNPDGIDSIMSNQNVDLIVFSVETSDKIRLLRQLNRENEPDIDEIIRRYSTDKEDFLNLDFHYNVLKNDERNDLRHNAEIVNAAAKRFSVKIN